MPWDFSCDREYSWIKELRVSEGNWKSTFDDEDDEWMEFYLTIDKWYWILKKDEINVWKIMQNRDRHGRVMRLPNSNHPHHQTVEKQIAKHRKNQLK